MTATLTRPPLPEPPAAAPPPRTPRHRDDVGPPGARPRWQRPATGVLLLGTALLYLLGLGASGNANSYYAAAVQAGTQSWKAFLFGSLDAGNAITVDKPPASLWLMELSGRLFGFSSWSMLVPQALLGVGSVWLLTATVRRWSGPGAGLVAGAVLALTPVAVLMFRYNQPDALLVFCLVAAAYAVTRAVQPGARSWWVVGVGVALGFAFLTKSLQGMTVLPALLAVYLVAAPFGWRRKLTDLALATVALVISGGWWFTMVSLWPASSRPYIGGSTDNSAWELAFGYNGLGRVTGGDSNGASFSGSPSLFRLFNAEMGGQISWLLPAALVLGVAAAVLGGRRARGAVVLFGGWLLVTAGLLSFMSGTVHPYYTVELAPAIAALVGTGVVAMWRQRQRFVARAVLAASLAATAAWSFVLLRRSSDFLPGLSWAVLAAGLAGAAALLTVGRFRAAVVAVLALGLVGGLGGSTAYAVQTASTAHAGSMATAGPTVSGSTGGPGGSGGAGGAGGPGGAGGTAGSGGTGGSGAPGGTPPSGSASGTVPSRGTSSAATGAATSTDLGAMAGGGGTTTTSSALTALLTATDTRWAAAVSGAQAAAELELATGTSVIGIGGFTGSDEAPTLATFRQWVADGDIGYYVVSGQGGGGTGGSSSAASEILAWVEANYTATTVGGTTVYALTG